MRIVGYLFHHYSKCQLYTGQYVFIIHESWSITQCITLIELSSLLVVNTIFKILTNDNHTEKTTTAQLSSSLLS